VDLLVSNAAFQMSYISGVRVAVTGGRPML